MQIQTKHIIWIFDAAGTDFQKTLHNARVELASYALEDKSKKLIRMSPITKTIGERCEELKETIATYEGLVEFCQSSKDKAVNVSSIEFAKSFAASFNT